MQHVIGVFINGSPFMPTLLPDQDIDLDHVIIGLTHSGQGWFANPRMGGYAEILHINDPINLGGKVFICLFANKIDRLNWLRTVSGQNDLVDLSMSVKEQFALSPQDEDCIPTNIYAAVLEYQVLMPHYIGTTSTLAP